MTTMFILMISSLSINMFMMMNPLSMGISILFMALSVAIMFSYSMSSWIAFLIFLIYISGMLVMFSYFVSLSPNQTTNMMSMIIMLMSTFIILSLMAMMMDMKTLSSNTYITQSNMFYLQFNSPTLILLALILLLTMIIVVKLTINSKGPLRPFMNKYV